MTKYLILAFFLSLGLSAEGFNLTRPETILIQMLSGIAGIGVFLLLDRRNE